MVEEYRQYWKPNTTRVILLAESHVFTRNEDRLITITQPLQRLPEYPTQYARFVYCLAYGESQLTGNDLHPRRDGTPQYWKLFYSCNNNVTNLDDFRPVLHETPYEQRIENKIELLLRLKQEGIWLVDASIVALYKTPIKLERGIKLSTIRQSWGSYTRSVIEEAAPGHIICVGKTVFDVLEEDIKQIVGNRYTVVCQPNARLPAEQHMRNYALCGEICNGDAGQLSVSHPRNEGVSVTDSDIMDLAQRITELEQKIPEIENGLYTHMLAIDSLHNSCNAFRIQLMEIREDLPSRLKDLENRLMDALRRIDKN